MTTLHRAKARHFRALHSGDAVLALANPWDVASARLVEQAGGVAVATTSAGVAWSLGAADGDRLARDRNTISLLVREIPAPLNILAGPGSPDIGQSAALGVARVSVGSAIAEAAYGLVRRATRELRSTGGYTELGGAVDYGEFNTLLGADRDRTEE